MLNRIYWWRLYKDIRLWFKFAKIAKQNRELLEKSNLRVDRIGRIYTVINLPEEIAKGNEYMHEAWVLQNLKPYSEVMLQIGLAGYAYPEVERINEPDAAAYLVVLYPEVDTISFRKILWNIIFYIGMFFAAKLIYKLIVNNMDTIEGWFSSIGNLFS